MAGFDDLLNSEKMKKHAQEAVDTVNGTTTSKDSNIKVSDLKIHSGFNIIHGNDSVVIARGTHFRACQGLFFKWPIFEKAMAIVSKEVKQLNIKPQRYHSQDSLDVIVDWYIIYKIDDPAKMFEKTHSIEETLQEYTEFIISSYLKQFTGDDISWINKLTEEDFDPKYFDDFRKEYGVIISEVKTNNIVVPAIKNNAEASVKAKVEREIKEAASKTEREIRTANANAELEVRKKELEIDKERLGAFADAINGSKAPEALARMMSNGQNMDIYHHEDQNPRRRR